jgi:hypothetical protein
MNDKESKKYSIIIIFYHVILIIGVIVSVLLSLKVYLENRSEGYINIFAPSRYGTMRGTHHNNTSDKILLCFTLHNNGNIFRNINRINLTLKDENGSQWNFEATGKLDNLKDLIFKKYPLISNPNYSLVTSISLDKNQFVSLNLLFYYKDDPGWINSGKAFRFKKGTYEGKITITSVGSDDNNYRKVPYDSDYFNFIIRYEPFENMIDTFTNINIGESKLNRLEEK